MAVTHCVRPQWKRARVVDATGGQLHRRGLLERCWCMSLPRRELETETQLSSTAFSSPMSWDRKFDRNMSPSPQPLPQAVCSDYFRKSVHCTHPTRPKLPDRHIAQAAAGLDFPISPVLQPFLPLVATLRCVPLLHDVGDHHSDRRSSVPYLNKKSIAKRKGALA